MKRQTIDKVAKPLPNRAALNRLDDSPRSLLDYAKASNQPQEPMPAVLALVGRKRR